MGKAAKAPAATYQRQFVISHHAIGRYRERVEKEHAARSDFDLGNLLDDRIRSAERHQTVVDLRNIDSVTRVFEVEHRDGSIYYAVVRDETVVTVLDRHMLEVNFENGSWQRGPMNTPFTRRTLRGVVPEEPAIKSEIEARAKLVEQDPIVPRIVEAVVPAPALPSDPIAEASLRVGKSMVAHAAAQRACDRISAEIERLNVELQLAHSARDRAADEVSAAQSALADAVDRAAQEES